MKHEEFQDKIWRKIGRARSLLEHAGIHAGTVDEDLCKMIAEAAEMTCKIQQRCSKIAEIGAKTQEVE